jgi:hypothetical protein
MDYWRHGPKLWKDKFIDPNQMKKNWDWVGVYQKVDKEPTVVFCTTSSFMPKLEHIEQ